jgi:protein-disulfide isomerase
MSTSVLHRIPLVLVALVAVACLGGPALAGPSATPVKGIAEVDSLFAGIPQHGNMLGNPKAKVTLYEFGDLRCPSCRNYETDYFPQFVRTWVRTGKVRVSFQLWPILGPDSIVAARAGMAAQAQNRFWQFAELFYLNQGSEDVHYVTPSFLDRIATGARLDAASFRAGRVKLYKVRLEGIDGQATGNGFQGTPTFVVSGPRGKLAQLRAAPLAAQFAPIYKQILAVG